MIFAMLALSSCEDSGILPSGNQSTHLNQAQADASGFFELENRLEEEEEWAEDECFDINYPVNVSFPDGTTQTVNTDAELDLAIDEWEMNNPNSMPKKKPL